MIIITLVAREEIFPGTVVNIKFDKEVEVSTMVMTCS